MGYIYGYIRVAPKRRRNKTNPNHTLCKERSSLSPLEIGLNCKN